MAAHVLIKRDRFFRPNWRGVNGQRIFPRRDKFVKIRLVKKQIAFNKNNFFGRVFLRRLYA